MEVDVPQGWDTYSLDVLFDFSNGVNADKSAYGDGIPFINVLEVITNDTLTDELIPGRIKLSASMATRYRVCRGDVLFNRTSETQDEVGLTSVYLGDSPIVFGGFVFRAQPKTKHVEIAYSAYALRAHYVREQIIARGQGGIRSNIGQRDLKTVLVLIPEADEQRAIASVLSDVSNQILILRRLIAKKQAIKQGMMQQLLTGMTRLSGFTGTWKHVALGDLIVRIVGGGTPSRSRPEFWGGELPWVTVKDFTSFSPIGTEEYITRAGFKSSATNLVPRGTLIVCTRMSVGKALTYDVDVCINQDLKAISFVEDINTDFMKHWFQYNEAWIAARGGGSTVSGLSLSDLRNLELTVPPKIQEQISIAAVLDEADADIGALRDRLAKAEAIKNGMMQELLTGRMRLPVKEAVA